MMAMWFILGLLCGMAVGVALCLPWERPLPDDETVDRERVNTRKDWVETHNFLYYDGTEMPVVKENVNEQ